MHPIWAWVSRRNINHILQIHFSLELIKFPIWSFKHSLQTFWGNNGKSWPTAADHGDDGYSWGDRSAGKTIMQLFDIWMNWVRLLCWPTWSRGRRPSPTWRLSLVPGWPAAFTSRTNLPAPGILDFHNLLKESKQGGQVWGSQDRDNLGNCQVDKGSWWKMDK